MKKTLTVTAIALASAGTSSAMAIEVTDTFVGAEVGMATVSSKLEVGGNQQNTSAKPIEYGIRGGVYLDDNIRVYGRLAQNKKSTVYTNPRARGILADITNRQLTASADYLFELGAPVKPFIGATLGANWSKVNARFPVGNSASSASNSTKFALAYGVQAGVLGQFGPVDVELGYRYLKHSNKLTNTASAQTLTTNITATKTPYLSASYKF